MIQCCIFFPRKLKSRWTSPFVIQSVTPNGDITLMNLKDGTTFQVNGHRVKPFLKHEPIRHEDVDHIDPI